MEGSLVGEETPRSKFFADGVPALFVILMLSSLPSVHVRAKTNTINPGHLSQTCSCTSICWEVWPLGLWASVCCAEQPAGRLNCSNCSDGASNRDAESQSKETWSEFKSHERSLTEVKGRTITTTWLMHVNCLCGVSSSSFSSHNETAFFLTHTHTHTHTHAHTHTHTHTHSPPAAVFCIRLMVAGAVMLISKSRVFVVLWRFWSFLPPQIHLWEGGMKASGSLWILWVLLVVSAPSVLRVSCGPACMLCTCVFSLHLHVMHLESALVQWFFFSQQKSLMINFHPAFIIHNYGL